MGDIADYHLDLMLSDGSWGMALPRRYKHRPTCQHCGKKGLNWQQVKGAKWRLHEGQKPHECAGRPTNADGFGEVSDA